MGKRFTDRYIKHTLKPQDKPYDKTEGDGFSIRVQPTGTKTFYYTYKVDGKKQRERIGEYDFMTLSDAREEAARLHAARKRGEDIKTSRDHDEGPQTVNNLADIYLRNYSKKKNTDKVYKENKRNLDNDVLPFIGSMELEDVKRKDIYALLQRIIDREAPVQSNNVLKVVRKMFNYGIQSGMLENNPAHLIEPQPEKEKDRVLSDKEIKTAWNGIDQGKIPKSTVNCLRLVLVTGQRPGECLQMLHEEIDGDWWTIPKEKTKNKNVPHATAHRVYLTALAKELIGEGSGRVFKRPAMTEALGNTLRRLFNSKRLKVDKFTPHDLRRTCATNIAELGFDQPLVDRLLGHTQGKIARTYNRYKYDSEKKEMLLAWEKKLLKILE